MTLASADPRRLILFVRWPAPGTTKTRLEPALGAAGAAALARRMTDAVVRAAKAVGCPVVAQTTGASTAEMQAWLDLPCAQQQGPDLGARMAHAIESAARAGASRILLAGTDCPQLDTEILRQGFAALDDVEVVLGPAADGGYYLIGMRTYHADLFSRMRWSHAGVLSDTLARLGSRSHSLLPILHDIDLAGDLVHLPAGFLP